MVEDRCREVSNLLSKGLNFEALVEALTDPPVTSKDKSEKVFQILLKYFSSMQKFTSTTVTHKISHTQNTGRENGNRCALHYL